MARTRWPSDLSTLASCPGQADQTGSAGGCLKTWDPAGRSSRRTARAASAESEVGPGPRLPTLRPYSVKIGEAGRKHYPQSPCRIFRLTLWVLQRSTCTQMFQFCTVLHIEWALSSRHEPDAMVLLILIK